VDTPKATDVATAVAVPLLGVRVSHAGTVATFAENATPPTIEDVMLVDWLFVPPPPLI